MLARRDGGCSPVALASSPPYWVIMHVLASSAVAAAGAATARVAGGDDDAGADADAASGVPSQSSTLRGVVSAVLYSCLRQFLSHRKESNAKQGRPCAGSATGSFG